MQTSIGSTRTNADGCVNPPFGGSHTPIKDLYITVSTSKKLQYLYLIASGNDDSIYKIGISDDPERRLEQIRRDYCVPDAYIVEYMDVPSRDEVFAIENALHARFDRKQSRKYSGREWFKLSARDLEDLRSLYQENSNSFAQARAYYGILIEMTKLKDQASTAEAERQRKIAHNRRHGKRHDTKPKGVLKKYNDLFKKSREGILGRRFDLRTIKHPVVEKSQEAVAELIEPVKEKTKAHGLLVAGCGAVFAGCVAASAHPSTAGTVFWSTGFFGLVAGSISSSVRRNRETNRLTEAVRSKVETLYPGALNQTSTYLADTKENKTLLIRGFNESGSELRNTPATMPRVDLSQSVIAPLKPTVTNRTYFPKVALGLTAGFGLFITAGNATSPHNPDNAGLLLTPPTIERIVLS